MSPVHRDPSRSVGLDAVLWDVDGTLVDTEPYWIAEEYALVDSFGGEWTPARAESLVGLDLLAAGEVLRDLGSVALAPREIVERLQAGVIDRIRDAVPWRPGARELLGEALTAGIPCAMVTMSWADLAGEVVDALPTGSFGAIVTGDQVRRGKPDPEPYRCAAERLGVIAERCVAIEDSPAGVASAVAAGVPTVAVPNVADVHQQRGVARIPTLAGVDLAGLARLRDQARDSC